MSAPVDVRWVPASTLPAVSEAVLRAAVAWAEAWGLEPPQLLGCEAVPARAPARPADAGLPDLAPAVSQALFGPGAARSPMAGPVVAQAVEAWRDALGAVLGLAPGQAWPAAGAAGPDHPGDRGLRCRLQVCGQPFSIFIGMEPLCTSQWIRIPNPAALAAWRPEAVMASLPVTLEALLGTASVAVGDLAAMEAGDVILMSQVAGATVRLRGLSAAADLQAELGHVAGRRAVRLAASSQGS